MQSQPTTKMRSAALDGTLVAVLQIHDLEFGVHQAADSPGGLAGPVEQQLDHDVLLGEGVASNARHDPQAKALGEWLGSRKVDVPEELLLW